MKRKNKETVRNSVEDQSGIFKRKKRRYRSKTKNSKRQRRDFDTPKKDTSIDHQSVMKHDAKYTNHSINFVEICSDIMFKILSCLPAKSLFRFKCVSKEICSLIEDPLFALEHSRRLEANLIPFTGFFVRKSCPTGYKPLFFKSTYNDAGGLSDASLSLLKEDKLKEDVQIIDSCNGLLLCTVKSNKEKLYVCNPLTKQKVFVPHPGNLGSTYRDKRFALMAQSTPTGYIRFKVVCVRRIPTKIYKHYQYSKLWIFSSESSQWEKFRYRLPTLSGLMIDKRTKIFLKGTLYWDCFESGQYILVCYFNSKDSSPSSKCFDLIESPSKDYYLRFLWDYNGTILYYSDFYESYNEYCSNGKFSSWSLCFGDNNKMEWKIENSEQFRNIAEDIWKRCHEKNYGQLPPRNEWWQELERTEFNIVGYNPSLKTVYLWMDNALVSYDLVKRKTKLVCGTLSGSYLPIVVYQYVHSLQPIEIGTHTAINSTVDDEIEYDDDPILRDDDEVPEFR